MDYESLFTKLKKEQVQKSIAYSHYHKRDIYDAVSNSNVRIKIISGLRGIGKTTILMHLLEEKKGFYISLDNPLLANIDVYDFLKFLIEVKGITYLLLDEVHYWLNWQQSIKSLYDIYNQVFFVLSGSAALALSNLERRAQKFDLLPLSFKEFLKYKDIIVKDKVNWKEEDFCLKFVIENKLEPLYDEYLRKGGFVFGFDLDEESFLDLLYESILKTIREDSVLYSKFSAEKRFGLEKILVKIALSYPGEISISKLSRDFDLSKETIYVLLEVLERSGLIFKIQTYSRVKYNRKESKLLFVHPNLRYVIAKKIGFEVYFGAMREESFVLNAKYLGYNIFLPKRGKKTPDFIITKGKEKLIMEVGTRNKNKTQIKEYTNGYVIDNFKLICFIFGRKTD